MRAILILLPLLATACDGSDSRVCGSLAAKPALGTIVQTADIQLQYTASCVERWAARLAGAPDAADQVAGAVLGACDDAIVAYEEWKAKEEPGSEQSLVDARRYWRQRAQFIVVQTRAGNCYPDA